MNIQPTTVNNLLGAIAGVLLMFVFLLAAEWIKDTPDQFNNTTQNISTQISNKKVVTTKDYKSSRRDVQNIN